MHPVVEKLFQEIEHGDEKHRTWLREKLELWSLATFGPEVSAADDEAVLRHLRGVLEWARIGKRL